MPSPHTLLCEAIAVLTSWVMVSFQHERRAECPIHLKCVALTTTTRQIWREEHTYPSVSPFFSVSGPCSPSLSCGDDAPFFPSCWLSEGTWTPLERISNELDRAGGILGLPPLLRLLWVALLFHPTSTFILWYFSPNPAFPNLLVPWNYIIFLLGSVPVLLGRGIVTLSGKTPRLASVEAAVASAWSHKGNAALHRPRCSCLSQRADGATFVCGGSQTFFLLSLLVCAPQGVVGPPCCDRTNSQGWLSLGLHGSLFPITSHQTLVTATEGRVSLHVHIPHLNQAPSS